MAGRGGVAGRGGAGVVIITSVFFRARITIIIFYNEILVGLQ